MLKLVENIQENKAYAKGFNFLKIFIITGGTQILVQGTALITGILIIRLLPVEEYAFYTIANTVLGTMTLLADGGIGTGVMSIGGQVWGDRQKLGSVLVSGMDLRRKFAIFSLIPSIPILIFLLTHQGASWLTCLLITLALALAFFATLADSLLEIVPKLHQDIKPLQANQAIVSIARLAMNCLFLIIFPWTFIALIANGLPRIYGNLRLKQISTKFADTAQLPDTAIKGQILKIVKRTFPLTVYYAYSGQIVIWLTSLLGTTSSVAQIGALGRISMLLGLVSMLFSILVIPRFARLSSNKNNLFKTYLTVVIGLFLLSILIIFLSNLFSEEILWILGKEYGHLKYEMVLSITGSCTNLISGSIYGLYSSRGWTMNPVFSIFINLSSIVIFINVLDISTLTGVLIFNITISIVPLILGLIFCAYKIARSS